MSSFTLRIGEEALTATISGNEAIIDMGAKSRSGEYGSFEYVAGLIVIGPLGPMRRVYPSGAALATISAAMMDCAPGLLSTTRGWPSPLDISGAMTRTMMSLPPPAE